MNLTTHIRERLYVRKTDERVIGANPKPEWVWLHLRRAGVSYGVDGEGLFVDLVPDLCGETKERRLELIAAGAGASVSLQAESERNTYTAR
jgi:hypothetical protein